MGMNTFDLPNTVIAFHRTVKSDSPPSLGHFWLHSVQDYQDKCPPEWEEDSFFIVIHKYETFFISFFGEPIEITLNIANKNIINEAHPPQFMDGFSDKNQFSNTDSPIEILVKEPSTKIKVYLYDADECEKNTGIKCLPIPVSFREYYSLENENAQIHY